MHNLPIPYSIIVLFYFMEGVRVVTTYTETEAFFKIINEFANKELAVFKPTTENEINNLLERRGTLKVWFNDNSTLLVKLRDTGLIIKSIGNEKFRG